MLNISKSVIAVILGGGAGTRLHPLTQSRSKPAVPIAGKYRLVDIPISNCINSNIHRMFVLTQYNSASLNKHIKNTYHFSNFSTGFVDILAAEQTPDSSSWFQGTADAVRQSFKHIFTFSGEYVLILSGDQLYQMDFDEMVTAHAKSGADITLATIPVGKKEASDFGILKANEENWITTFTEKPKQDALEGWDSDTGEAMKSQGKVYLASMGIYIFNRQLLADLLLKNHPDDKDFGKEIIPKSIGNYKVFSYQYEGYWEDIGQISSFFEANLLLTDELPPFNLFDNNNIIYSRARMLPPAKISGTTMERTVLADGSILHAESINHAVIGIRSRIGHGTRIQSTYIMGNDYFETMDQMQENLRNGIPPVGIGERCHIEKAIVDKNCRIGNDVTIRGGTGLADQEHELYTIKDDIVVIKKNAIIPDGYVIQ
ncbi:glucose-1-phosphate adenylyltransferase [Aridibaculum aurantiacum]|uniref:glucose-1-phosphate adenylyltransferase n=1 Tax=Aridibaculum aurantiacum TaxID=2810307 RepID=UPI001A974E43|nr:glucose-1-phosphate adenylyltransferase [Aridibaculum aurantiacum]